jgi:hypothetical protein
VLAARTWVKLNEPLLLEARRKSSEERFRREQRVLESEAARLLRIEEEEREAELRPIEEAPRWSQTTGR